MHFTRTRPSHNGVGGVGVAPQLGNPLLQVMHVVSHRKRWTYLKGSFKTSLKLHSQVLHPPSDSCKSLDFLRKCEKVKKKNPHKLCHLMSNYTSHKHNHHWLGAHHLTEASCKFQSSYFKIFRANAKSAKSVNYASLCKVILIWYFWKNIFNLQISIRLHPFQISSLSDYCAALLLS